MVSEFLNAPCEDKGDTKIVSYYDVDWARFPYDTRSTLGYCGKLNLMEKQETKHNFDFQYEC